MDSHPVSEAAQEQINQIPPNSAPDAPADAAPGSAPIWAPSMTQRDVQRAALRDLVALATEGATTENEVEQTCRGAVEIPDKDLGTTPRCIEQRCRSSAESIRHQHNQR